MADQPPKTDAHKTLQDRRSTTLDRREFLGYVGAVLASAACGDMPRSASAAQAFPTVDTNPDVPTVPPPPAPNLPKNPFTLGVACGDPLPDGFVIWTRLAPSPLEGGGMPDLEVPVVWEIAHDRHFRDVVHRDWLYTQPELAHSAHVDVRGLEPDSWYWYRFRVGDQWQTAPGRARTFPRPSSHPERFRIATASCQNYVDGYYTAHRHMSREELDLVAFLGDYIYEYGYGDGVRSHKGPTLQTLDQFRQRYALYKSDRDLQASHANCPWVFTWDDHEVSNNYAGLEPDKSNIEDFKKMRAAAYQAYFEHMPLRVPLPDDPSSLQIYRSAQFGDLINLYVLDGRQYRSGIICDGEFAKPCDEALSPEETMLGDSQQAWLTKKLKRSPTIWNAICQQTVFSPVNFDNTIINPDQWDGYQYQRQELLNLFASDAVENVTVLTGDIHSAGFAQLRADDDDPEDSSTVGYEIVATSITSGNSTLGGSGDISDLVQEKLGYIKYFNAGKRGYCLLEYTRDACEVRYRTVSTVEEREADIMVDKAFRIEADTLEFS